MTQDIALSRLLDGFLFEHPEPTSADWRTLLKAHPEFREDIAEFASTFSSLHHVDEDDVRSNFGFATEGERLLAAIHERGSQEGADPLELLGTHEGREEVTTAFGLQDYLELALGIFIGQVQVPAKVVSYLSKRAQCAPQAIRDRFAALHGELAVSMSSREKPESMKLLTWEEEVNRLVKDTGERQRLLSLDQE
jgi:hypothetical protein